MEPSPRRARWPRLALLIPAAAMMLLGLNAGLILIGLPAPLVVDRLPELHATLLVFGFIGSLISLERAAALRSTWALAAPLLLVVGSLLTLTALPVAAGAWIVVAGLAVHLAQYAAIWRRQPMTATAVQALGAAVAIAAAAVWAAGAPPARLVPALATFLILTIAGERLELARALGPGRRAEALLMAASLALAAGSVLAIVLPAVAVPAAGVALLLLAAWLLRHDVARATVRASGLPRYVAVCLLSGYVWLLVAGAGWLLAGDPGTGPVHDAVVHAIFLGFVITMIMAHAPVILPAVLGVRVEYHPVLYIPVALLHASLLLRVVAGDAWGSVEALRIGGFGAVVAMLLFGVTAATVSVRAALLRRRRRRREETRDAAA